MVHANPRQQCNSQYAGSRSYLNNPIIPMHNDFISDDGHLEIAHHEAGHAVAAWLHERRISKIWITEDYDGCCTHNLEIFFDLAPLAQMEPSERRIVEQRVQIILAGALAQRQFNPRAEILKTDQDEVELQRITHKLFPEQQNNADEWIATLRNEAQRMIVEAWNALEALAHELVDKKTLTGEMATQILRKKYSALPDQ